MGDRGSTGESHVARLFKFAPPMCSVHSRTGHGHALRLVRLAASSRQLTAVAQPLQGSVTSARSCVPLRVQSITTGVSHLRSRSFIMPPSESASVRCWRLRRLIRDARLLLACPFLAASDPKARRALHIQRRSNRPCTTSPDVQHVMTAVRSRIQLGRCRRKVSMLIIKQRMSRHRFHRTEPCRMRRLIELHGRTFRLPHNWTLSENHHVTHKVDYDDKPEAQCCRQAQHRCTQTTQHLCEDLAQYTKSSSQCDSEQAFIAHRTPHVSEPQCASAEQS